MSIPMFPSAWAPGKLPFAPGSGKFGTPCERTHWANLRVAPSSLPGLELPVDPDDAGCPAEDLGSVVVLEPPAGAGFPDEGTGRALVVEPTAATPGPAEGPPPHAGRASVTAATAATSATVPRGRAGHLTCALQPALLVLSERPWSPSIALSTA